MVVPSDVYDVSVTVAADEPTVVVSEATPWLAS